MRNPILTAAIALGLIAAFATVLYFRRAGSTKQKETPTPAKVDTVVAKQDIHPHMMITPDMVEVVASSGAPQAGALQSVQQAVGRVAWSEIPQGTTLLASQIAQPSIEPVAFAVPLGRRAYAFNIDPALGTGGLVQPGDYVDVLTVYTFENSQAISRTIVQNVEVLMVQPLGAPKAEPGTDKEKESKAGTETQEKGTGAAGPKEHVPAPKPGESTLRIVLAVTPEQAQAIAAARQKGDIALTIRNANDQDYVTLDDSFEYPFNKKPGVLASAKATAKPAPAPAAPSVPHPSFIFPPMPTAITPPKPPRTVEVIRGTSKESVPVE